MAHAKHGHCKDGSSSRTYRIWAGIRNRCSKAGSARYIDNGITVCERWGSFENFLTDVGEIPSDMSLDRIDNSKGYKPGNVRLATMKEQGRNRSSNRIITIDGVSKTLTEWCGIHGVAISTVYSRIGMGWPETDWFLPAQNYNRDTPTGSLSRTRAYRVWHGIRNRCGTKGHARYIAEGITLCERWQDFANFFEDIGEIPPGMSVDRIDNAKGYEPGNVRLATAKQQARNRTSNHLLTIGCVTKTLAEWSEEHGLPPGMLRQRVAANWPEKDLLLPKGATQDVMLTIDGRTMNMSDWAREAGISKQVLWRRIDRGWPREKWLIPTGATQDNLLTVGKRTMNLAAWSRETGIKASTISKRIREGWPPEKCIEHSRLTLNRSRA